MGTNTRNAVSSSVLKPLLCSLSLCAHLLTAYAQSANTSLRKDQPSQNLRIRQYNIGGSLLGTTPLVHCELGSYNNTLRRISQLRIPKGLAWITKNPAAGTGREPFHSPSPNRTVCDECVLSFLQQLDRRLFGCAFSFLSGVAVGHYQWMIDSLLFSARAARTGLYVGSSRLFVLL